MEAEILKTLFTNGGIMGALVIGFYLVIRYITNIMLDLLDKKNGQLVKVSEDNKSALDKLSTILKEEMKADREALKEELKTGRDIGEKRHGDLLLKLDKIQTDIYNIPVKKK